MPDSSIHIQLFGGLRIVTAGKEPIEFSRQQTGALLGYLALHPGLSRNREELVAIFWPEDDPEDGRRKLRQAIYALRRQFESHLTSPSELFVSTRDTIRINERAVSTDVLDFEVAVRQAKASEDPRARLAWLQKADQLYRGDLMAGFYQDAILACRADFSVRHGAVLHDIVMLCESLGMTDDAVNAARRILAKDPLAEDAYIKVMQLCASVGRSTEVRRLLGDLERTLASELGTKPSKEVYRLADRLSAIAELPMPLPLSKPPAALHNRSDDSIDGPIYAEARTPVRKRIRRRALALWTFAIIAPLGFIALGRVPHRNVVVPAKTSISAVQPSAHLFWQQRYKPQTGDRSSEPVAVAADRNGYFVVGGFVQTLKTDVDALVAGYDSYGNPMWEKRFDGEAHDLDRLTAMTMGPDGSVYAAIESMGKTGCGNERLSELDIMAAKIGPTGRTAWTKTYRGAGNGLDSPTDIGLDASGNVYVLGRSWQAKTKRHGLVLLKYSPLGKLLWTYPFATKDQNERSVNLAVAGSAIYVAAHTNPAEGAKGDNLDLLLKLGLDGREQWRRPIKGIGGDTLRSPRVAVDSAGAIYFAVQSLSEIEQRASGKSSIVMHKFRADGSNEWRRELPAGRKDQDFPTDLKADPRGGVVVAGHRLGPISYILCADYTSAGELRYANKIYTDPGPSSVPPAVAIDADGHVAVTGSIFTGLTGVNGHDQDLISAYYHPDGTVAWKSKIDGKDHLRDTAIAVAMSPEKVYVAGQITEGGIPEIQILNYSPYPIRVSSTGPK